MSYCTIVKKVSSPDQSVGDLIDYYLQNHLAPASLKMGRPVKAKASAKAGTAERLDYYLDSKGNAVQPPGRWWGKGAAELGLVGEVTAEQLERTFQGQDPATGKSLVRRGAGGQHVLSIECTFAPDKSFSLVWAAATPDERSLIEAAHRAAVEYALTRVEDQLKPLRRRIKGGGANGADSWEREATAGLVVAEIEHQTSRPSAEADLAEPNSPESAPDMQIHTHALVMSLALRQTPDSRGNRWAAVESRALMEVQQELGKLYGTALSSAMQDLGYGIERHGRFARVAGVTEELRAAYSSRTHEVAAARDAWLRDNPGERLSIAQAKDFGAKTKRRKRPVEVGLFERWQEGLAQRFGFTSETLEQMREEEAARRALPEHDLVRSFALDHSSPDEVIRKALGNLTMAKGSFGWNTLKAEIAAESQGALLPEELTNLLVSCDGAEEEGDPTLISADLKMGLTAKGKVVLTTLDALSGEQIALEKIADLRSRPRAMLNAEQLEHGAVKAELSEEQRTAIQTINAQSGLAVLEAGPGTGKSHSMNALATAWRQAHPKARVITVAVAGRASSELAHKVAGAEARTVESFARDRSTLTADDLVLVDEASQLDGARAVTLLSKVADAGAFTVLLGDRTQLGKVVGSGGIFAHLADEAERVGHLAVLTENRRAIDPLDAHAWERLREGESMEALEHFDAKGLIHLDSDRDQALHRAIENWATDHAAGKETVIVTDGSNSQIDLLNSFARDRLIKAGQVQADHEIEIGFKDGDYHRTEKVAVGDEVTLGQTSYLPSLDPRFHTVTANRRVNNGERLKVVEVKDKALIVELRNGRLVIVGADKLERVRLNYALSAYRSQGATVDTAHVVTGHWNTRQESAVVAMTRARERSEVYASINDLIDWPGGMRTSEAEKLALQALGERFGASERDEMVSDQIERWKAAHDTALEEQAEVSRHANESQQRMAQAQTLQRAA